MTWSLDSTDDDDGEFAVRIVAALAAEANTSASSFGVGDWAERALAAAARSTPGRRSDVQAAAGWSALNRGDLDGARALGLQAVDGGVPVDSSAPSVGYVLLGFLELINGRGDLAAERVAEGLAALEAFPTPMPADRATIAVTAGAYRAFEGDIEGAVTEATEALRLAREVGSASILANALTIVVVATWVDDPRRAEPLLDEAIELVRTQGGAGVMFPIMLVIRAQLRLGDSDPAAAIAALRESVDFLQDRGDLPQLVTVLDYGIQTLANLGNAEAAGVLAGFSLDGPLAPLGNMPPSLHPRRTDALERSPRGARRRRPRRGTPDAARPWDPTTSSPTRCASSTGCQRSPGGTEPRCRRAERARARRPTVAEVAGIEPTGRGSPVPLVLKTRGATRPRSPPGTRLHATHIPGTRGADCENITVRAGCSRRSGPRCDTASTSPSPSPSPSP